MLDYLFVGVWCGRCFGTTCIRSLKGNESRVSRKKNGGLKWRILKKE